MQMVGKLQKNVFACYCKKSHYVPLLRSSDTVNFYTGIENIVTIYDIWYGESY